MIWDWNGTLLDDLQLVLRVVNGIFADHGVPTLNPERYRHIFDFPVQSYYTRAGLILDDAQFAAVSERFGAEFEQGLDSAELFSDARTTLADIDAAGFQQLLLSGTEHVALTRMLARFELTDHFQIVQGAADGLAVSKRDAAHALAKHAELSPAHTLMIGDTLHDAEVAQALGADCVLVTSGHHSHERLQAAGVPVVDSLTEVRALLNL